MLPLGQCWPRGIVVIMYVRYRDISETQSCRATKFWYVMYMYMYLVNYGKHIKIDHACQRIYRVMPLFQLLFIPWYHWNKITFSHYRDISETKSRRPTKFGYVMYLVNCGKPIEIGHGRQRIMHDHTSHKTFIKLHLEVWHDLFILYMSVHWDHMRLTKYTTLLIRNIFLGKKIAEEKMKYPRQFLLHLGNYFRNYEQVKT